MWVLNLMAPIFLDAYKPDPSVNAIFMIVIGALFGEDAISRAKKPKKETPPQIEEGQGDGS